MSEETNVEQTETETTLTVNDMTVMLQVIQAVAARGAIRADEMEVVGGVYRKLVAFLEEAGVITREPAEVTGETEKAADEATNSAE